MILCGQVFVLFNSTPVTLCILSFARYSSYTLEALQLAKFMIRSLLGQKLPTKAQDQVMKAVTPTDILTILRKYDGTNPNGGNKITFVKYDLLRISFLWNILYEIFFSFNISAFFTGTFFCVESEVKWFFKGCWKLFS